MRDLKMLPRQGNETNDERQVRLSAELAHEFETKTGQFANYDDNPYPSLNEYNEHGDDEYQAKKLKKQQDVAECKEELNAKLKTINAKIKMMRGGPIGEPNSVAFVAKRQALMKQKEEILAQLNQL